MKNLNLKLKSIYLKNLVSDFWNKRKCILGFVVVCAVLFAFLGARKAQAVRELTQEQIEEIEEYQEKLEEYDKTIADAQESLDIVNGQIEEQQKYIDQSIYMKLDGQNLYTASVQYGVTTEANVGNILNALVLYINEGGLKEALSEEYPDLAVEGWREVISPSITANLLNITIIHYDEEQLKQIFELVKTRVKGAVPEIEKVQGNFALEEIESSIYVKADVGVTNNQNNNLNNLKNYTNNRVDLENKLISQQNNKKSYLEKNEPEVMEARQVNPVVQTIAYMIVGVLFGIVLPALVFILSYILSDRIRSKEDLRNGNINVIGSYSEKKQYEPALERSVMDLEVLAKQQQLSSIFLNVMGEDELSKKTASEYAEVIAKAGYAAETGFHVQDEAEELKKMVESKACVLFVQAGKNTYSQLEQQLCLCDRFQVKVLGCVVIE